MIRFRNRVRIKRAAALVGVLILFAGVAPKEAVSQESEASPPPRAAGVAPYDSRLQRLSEVLGSIHYLRNLCGETSNQWRDQMEGLLAVEKPTPNRRARLIAQFNKGYRSFSSVYATCTPQALTAVNRYMIEGKDLAGEINSRYAE